jgi:hypothetical protein
MSSLLEGAITGILTGAILLGVAGCWVGFIGGILMSGISLFNGEGVWRTAFDFGLRASIFGATIGGIIGISSKLLFEDVHGSYVGAAVGMTTLSLGALILATSDSSSKNVQVENAIKMGVPGLLIGAFLGCLIGWIGEILVRNF